MLGQLLLHFEHQVGTIDQDQLRAFGGHAFGNAPPDALGRAGDQRDFIVESVHVYLMQVNDDVPVETQSRGSEPARESRTYRRNQC